MKKVYNNTVNPIRIRKSVSLEDQAIYLFNEKTVFYEDETHIQSLDIDETSSAIFLNPKIQSIPNTVINSNELLLIDRDCRVIENILINSGGEMRVI